MVRKLRSRKGSGLGALKPRPKFQRVSLLLRIGGEAGGGVFRSVGSAGRKHRPRFYL